MATLAILQSSAPRGTPIFFHLNDHKGCTLDYLDGLGHFLFGFWEKL